MNPFTEHPRSVGETYWQHMAFAFRFSAKCFMAAFYASIHALFPFLCTKSASKIILQLAHKIGPNRIQQDDQ